MKESDFKITLWIHTDMTYEQVAASIEEIMPSAGYVIEDMNALAIKLAEERVPRIAISPGMKTVEVRDELL